MTPSKSFVAVTLAAFAIVLFASAETANRR